jgi:nucleoid DNA-binding protein
MRYGTLVAKIASLTAVSDADVRRVLSALPTVVMECNEGECLRTPMGVFKVTRRPRKRVRSPFGDWMYVPERVQAKLRSGKTLQRELSSEPQGDLEDPELEDPLD